jgi:hypothetical protein
MAAMMDRGTAAIMDPHKHMDLAFTVSVLVGSSLPSETFLVMLLCSLRP